MYPNDYFKDLYVKYRDAFDNQILKGNSMNFTSAKIEQAFKCGKESTNERVILGRDSSTDDDQKLIEILSQPIFQRQEGLTALERCRQSYDALRILVRAFPLTRRDIVECGDRLLRLHEWIGFVDGTLLTLLTIHYNLCLGCILQNKAESQDLDDIINKLLSCESIGVFLATELGYGNNVIQLKTEAHYDEENCIFSIVTTTPEAKKFMPNTGLEGVAKIACVLARLIIKGKNQGVFPFIVPIRDEDGCLFPGVHVTPLGEKPGYDLDNAITWFDHVQIPLRFGLLGNDAYINKNGEFYCSEPNLRRRFLKAIDRVQMGKLCLSGGIAQGLKSVIKIAFCYSDQRKTFAPGRSDVSIFSYSSHKYVLIESLIQVLAINAFYEKVADLRLEHRSDIEFNYYLAALKTYVSAEALYILNQMRERVGAQGLFSKNGIIDHITTVHGVITAEGDNHVIKSKMAQDLLFKKELTLFDVCRYKSKSLLNVDFQKNVMRSRTKKLFNEIKTNLSNDRVLGKKLFASWNQQIARSFDMIDAHTSCIVHQSISDQADKSESLFSKKVYSLVQSLFFILEIDKNQGAYLAEGVLNIKQVKSLSNYKMEICDELYDIRHDIIESLNIPDNLIRSPLLSDYVKYYDDLSSPINKGDC